MSRATFTNGGVVANETMFLTSGASGLFVEYDLGLVVGRLENMYVWNYGEPFFGDPRGVSNLVVQYKINLADPWTLLDTNTLLKASYSPPRKFGTTT